MLFEATWLRLQLIALAALSISGEWMQNRLSIPPALWSLSHSDNGVRSSSDSGSILPGTQRMPQSFSGFLAGGRTSNGFDLESFTKNAAIETNKQHQALASQLNMAALIDQPHVPNTARLFSESQMPRQLLLQNRGFNGIVPSASMPSLSPSMLQKALMEAVPGAFLQRSSRLLPFNPTIFDGARNGIGSDGENFEDMSFGDARLPESGGFPNLRGNFLPAHARSSASNDRQTTFTALPFLRTFPSDLSSGGLESSQRSGYGLAEIPSDQFFGRGSQLIRPGGSVTISQRPLTDADKTGGGINRIPWFSETPTFSRIAPSTSNARVQKDDLLEESHVDENDSRNDLTMSK